jgi:carbonic anhydrase
MISHAETEDGNRSLEVVCPEECIVRLRKGNERFVRMNRLPDPGVSFDTRKSLLGGQSPYATILDCSDSRVPPELIFDEGLGRLFVVRVAGNVLSPVVLGSIEYASLHSTSRLVVVLGHESCGAVSAAVQALEQPDGTETSGINDIMNRLMLAVVKARKKTGLQGKELIEAAARENVRMTVRRIADESESLREMQNKHLLMIVGAYYSLSTGEVDIWA